RIRVRGGWKESLPNSWILQQEEAVRRVAPKISAGFASQRRPKLGIRGPPVATMRLGIGGSEAGGKRALHRVMEPESIFCGSYKRQSGHTIVCVLRRDVG